MPRLDAARAFAVLFCLALAAGCQHSTDDAPHPDEHGRIQVQRGTASTLSTYTLVGCNSSSPFIDSLDIGPAGDSVTLETGDKLIVPPGAVSQPTRFTLQRVGGVTHRRVIAHGKGFKGFVTLVIRYEGCSPPAGTGERDLAIVRIGNPSQDAGTVTLRGDSSVAVRRPNLSGYALAVPQ